MLNRERGLIEFNQRVLAQAEDETLPLLERLKFLCIVSSNLDEFFEIHVSLLKAPPSACTIRQDVAEQETLTSLLDRVRQLLARQYHIMNMSLLPALRTKGIHCLYHQECKQEQQQWLNRFFVSDIMPVLSPLGLDPVHSFPKISNKSLNFVVELTGRQTGMAIVEVPRVLPDLIQLPSKLCPQGVDTFVFLSSVIHEHMHLLFLEMSIKRCTSFRITRNSELQVLEEDIKNLPAALQGELRQRPFGQAVRLEVSSPCPRAISTFLLEALALGEQDLFRVDGPINLVRLASLANVLGRPDLKYPLFSPSLPTVLAKAMNLFDAIKQGDILLHHPYQSFQPIIDLFELAASDEQVVAIKMTVYRIGTDSVLMEALIAAAYAGKQVTVVVELMARFDEEANINWASRLEEAGAHVVYGVLGYKVHAKMSMIMRREATGLKHYIHLSTGNYHPRTAKLYTDIGLLTCNEKIASDISDLFVQITGFSHPRPLTTLYQSPFTLHTMLLNAIERETAHALAGRPARMMAKMNALTEEHVITALYRASQAGVEIQLIIRGACTLRPAVAGLSERITVRSVLGRFLEHQRIFYFYDNGKEPLFIASADWMWRNFFRRIEICVPILDPIIKRRLIKEGLQLYLEDTVNAWQMQSDGSYQRQNKGRRCVQQRLLGHYVRRQKSDDRGQKRESR